MNRPLNWTFAAAMSCAASGAVAGALPVTQECCAVLELRQYVLKSGRRDDLIEVFDRHFLEGQEVHAMRIVGQFRNPAAPDRFVWLRGFDDMHSRHTALTEFYGGPVWQAHREAANDTMLDVSDVLLLKPAGSGAQLHLAARPAPGAASTEGGLVVINIHYLRAPADAGLVRLFDEEAAPLLRGAGADLRGRFVTEPARNTFTRLPVREGENVFLWIASFPGRAAYDSYRKSLAADGAWAARVAPGLEAASVRPAETLELLPTSRSRLRHSPGAAPQ